MKKKPDKSLLVKKIVDNFLIKKEGKSILKDISKKNLIRDGIIDSLDLLTLASIIEKKTGKKILISSPKIYNKFNNYSKLIKILS
ncbi:hypothetical protein OAT03_00690 [Candidatus Pelagibacter sp.]|nr:hypothetical protein [Candidatus Pelagibacter sp.]